jgi:hypothetical protein
MPHENADRDEDRLEIALEATLPPLVARVLYALHLVPGRLRCTPIELAASAPLPSLAARAIRLAAPSDTAEHERRLLHLAEGAAPLDVDPTMPESLHEGYAYLARACIDWATDRLRPPESRDPALIAAVALAASIDRVTLERHDLAVRLREASNTVRLDRTVRLLARRLGDGEPLEKHALHRKLLLALERAGRDLASSRRTRSRRRRAV